MKWRKLLTPELLPDLARELAWRLGSREPEPGPRSWPVSAGELEGVAVRWPQRCASPVAPRFVQFLRWSFERRLEWQLADLPQHPAAVIFELEIEDRVYRHAIDVMDVDTVNDEVASSCDLYFKYQFSERGYPHPNVLPGGYPPKAAALYTYLPHLRRIRDRDRNRFDVYGRFSTEMAGEIRRHAHRLLSGQTAFGYEGSLEKVRYLRFLMQAAQSKVCIDLPGQGAFCYRLVDNLAIGSCIVGPEPRNRLPVPLQDGVHMAFCKPDLSDLVSLCEHYLAHDEERLRLVRGSRDYFDRYLHRDQVADYYLRCCLDHHRRVCGAEADGKRSAPPVVHGQAQEPLHPLGGELQSRRR